MAKFEQWEYPPDPGVARPDLGGLTLDELQAVPFEGLGRFKRAGRFPPDYGSSALSFFAPRDPGVHEVLVWTILQATNSVVVNMYGFDDSQLADLIRVHTEDPGVAVTLSLDKVQAADRVEHDILEHFNHDLVGNSIAIGHSERGAISHDKLLIIDGVYVVSGSTNWSYGGERLQDNQLTLTRDAVAAAEARAVIDLDHDAMLKQMARQRADGTAAPRAAAPAHPQPDESG
jgi:phosphatidylserine/phosphatidylglycerophosphate/cardiolipin synthase-like enzyme